MSGATGLISAAHTMLAMGLGPHWMLSESDAKRYGQALANAARHFPVRTTQKAIDIGVLIMTAFVIDAPRIGMTIQQNKARAAAPPQQRRGPAQVFQFTPNPAQTGGAPSSQPSSSQAAQAPPPPPLADPPPPLEDQGGGGFP